MAASETIEKNGKQYTISFRPRLEPYVWIVDRRDGEKIAYGWRHCATLAEAREWVDLD